MIMARHYAVKKLVGTKPKLHNDDEVIRLGKDLVAWLDDPKGGKEEMFFVGWYFDRHGMFRGDFKALTHRTLFLPYYEIALKKIVRNIVKCKEISQSYGNRYLAMYDYDLRSFEKEVREEEAAIKRLKEQTPDSFKENIKEMSNFFDKIQTQKNPAA